MSLSKLKPAEGSTRKRKRIGRGVGSGYGGHSSTRGNKGYKSRSGSSIPAWFEGGQMPLQRRVPKGGFKNPFRKEYAPVNLAQVKNLIDAGKIDAAKEVTPEVLVEAGAAGPNDLIKILGNGDIDAALNITAHAFSGTARSKIEAAGGTVTTVKK